MQHVIFEYGKYEGEFFCIECNWLNYETRHTQCEEDLTFDLIKQDINFCIMCDTPLFKIYEDLHCPICFEVDMQIE